MKKTKINLVILAFLAIANLTFQSCGEVEDPPEQNEEELITSVELTFTNSSDSSDVRTFSFKDTDGEGGDAPSQFDTIRLDTNSMYSLAIRFLDESSADVEDITEEVLEEADDHLVCYTTSSGTTATVTDKDGNNLDLGLAANVSTTDAEIGTFLVVLKHQPGIKTGDCAVGDTDVEVSFQFEVE